MPNRLEQINTKQDQINSTLIPGAFLIIFFNEMLTILSHQQEHHYNSCFILNSSKTYLPLVHSSIQCQITKQGHADYLLKLVFPTRTELEVYTWNGTPA